MGKITSVKVFDGTHLIKATLQDGELDYEVAQADAEGKPTEPFQPYAHIEVEAHETLLRALLSGEAQVDIAELVKLSLFPREAAAILDAAEHIEKHPELYNFFADTVPSNEGERACAFGRIGYFLQMSGESYAAVAKRLNMDQDAAHQIDKYFRAKNPNESRNTWRSAKLVAEWLRSLVW